MKTNLSILLLLICLSIPLTAAAQTVYIPDPNLRAAIRAAVPEGPITAASMAEVKTLEAVDANINNLTGLEYATALFDLSLLGNNISDISPISRINSTGIAAASTQ